MYKNLLKISTKNMTRAQWVAARNDTIGGSDAAAICGLSEYSSPYDVYCRKLHLLPEKPDTEAMRQGRDLEEYVAKRFCEETGKKVRRENAILKNAQYPFAHANVDRLIIGENAGLECKTTRGLGMELGDNPPEHYYVQCVHYMAVTGADRWYLAILVFGVGFKVYIIERDESEINALMDLEKDFFEKLQTKTPPIIDGSDITTKDIDELMKSQPKTQETIDLAMYSNEFDRIFDLKEKIKSLKDEENQLKNTIKLAMQNVETAISGRFKATYKAQTRTTFDFKRFAKEHANIDLTDYTRITKCMQFKIINLED